MINKDHKPLLNDEIKEAMKQTVTNYFHKEPSYNDRNIQSALMVGHQIVLKKTFQEKDYISARFTEKILSARIGKKTIRVCTSFIFNLHDSFRKEILDLAMEVPISTGEEIDMDNNFKADWR